MEEFEMLPQMNLHFDVTFKCCFKIFLLSSKCFYVISILILFLFLLCVLLLCLNSLKYFMALIFVFSTTVVENELQWNKFILFLWDCMENHHLKCIDSLLWALKSRNQLRRLGRSSLCFHLQSVVGFDVT
jgi:hypothetical protein